MFHIERERMEQIHQAHNRHIQTVNLKTFNNKFPYSVFAFVFHKFDTFGFYYNNRYTAFGIEVKRGLKLRTR